jgi:hypothetical protein
MRRSGAGPTSTLIALSVLMTLAGCGSATTPERETPILLVIESDGARDGFVRSDGFVRVVGSGPGVGDLDDARLGLGLRMFYSFPLREIPADAVITSMTLRVYQEATVGQPFSDLGELLVDHVDPGDALDPDDYDGNTLTSNVGSLSRDFERRYAILGVEDCVGRDLAEERTRSWFRLRFTRDSNLDGRDDLLLVNDGENSRGTGNLPLLEIIYLRP